MIGSFKLLQNKRPAHTALSVHEFLVKKYIPMLMQAPYSPALSSCDLYLFPKINSRVKDYHFNTWQCSKCCNQPLRNRLPILLWGMENLLGQVYCIRRMFFLRGQCWFRWILILYKIFVNTPPMPPLPHMSPWHCVQLIKYRDNFTFFSLTFLLMS
jgi:hypothetical protein